MREMALLVLLAFIVAFAGTASAQELLPEEPGKQPAPTQDKPKELTLEERIQALVEQLGAKQPSVRDDAVKQLVEIGEPVIETVVPLLESDVADVRFQAKKILDELHYVTDDDAKKIDAQIDLCFWGGEATEADDETKKLIADLSSDDWQTREDATEALKKKGLPALREVSGLLDSQDPEVKTRAESIAKAIREAGRDKLNEQVGRSLETIEGIRTAPYCLVKSLKEKSSPAREAIVARFLSSITGLMTIEDIRDPNRRRGGSMTMTTMNGVTRVTIDGKEVQLIDRNASADSVLGHVASNEEADKDLRLLCIETLKAREAVQAVESLVKLLRKSRGMLQLEVAEALRELTGQDFGPTRESTFEEVDKALEQWDNWWKDNKDKDKYRSK
jgi:uncharacterized protein (UPF0297 family)